MQAFSYMSETYPYNAGMKTGRPSDKPRTPLGERITQARQQAGLTQAALAAKLDTTQRAVAYWEREAMSLRADQMAGLAQALGVSADFFLGRAEPGSKRGNGPTGRMRQIFEAASTMPRDQQQKVADVLEAFVAQHAVKAS